MTVTMIVYDHNDNWYNDNEDNGDFEDHDD